MTAPQESEIPTPEFLRTASVLLTRSLVAEALRETARSGGSRTTLVWLGSRRVYVTVGPDFSRSWTYCILASPDDALMGELREMGYSVEDCPTETADELRRTVISW